MNDKTMTASNQVESAALDIVTGEKTEVSLGEKITPEANKSEHYMSGAKLNILVFALGLALFIMALDMSILTTAIPMITEKFNSTADIGWYMSSYLLTL
jgi:hypothetical protein